MRGIILRRSPLSHATWSMIREETRERKRSEILKTRTAITEGILRIKKEILDDFHASWNICLHQSRERTENFKGKYFHKNFLLYFSNFKFSFAGDPKTNYIPFQFSAPGTSFSKNILNKNFLIDQIKMIKNILITWP